MACSHDSVSLGRHPDISHFRVALDFKPLTILPVSFH
ncbi:hypothetical protein MXB_2524 [Myxobolus squamalis]|nr:hypothetical protein MXB_2524 [Myxobolus squamalis]